MSGELDPRWEWVEVTTFGQTGRSYIKGRCRHLDVVPVEASPDPLDVVPVPGRPVAHLCLTCDAQLP